MNIKNYEEKISNLERIIAEQEDEIFQLKSIIDDLPGDVYWKRFKGEQLIYSGMNRTGTASLSKMGFKWKITDILGKTDYSLFDKKTADIFSKNDWAVIHKADIEKREEIAVLPSGKKIIQLSTKRPLVNKKGQIIGLVGISIDVTELKEVQSALEIALKAANASDHAKTEFLENMRHDIRTPLTGIVGCAQLIKMDLGNSQKIAEYADDLIQSSDALLEFFNKILESITVANGEIPLLKKRFNLKEVLEQIIRLNQSQATVKRLALNLYCEPSIPAYLIGDPVRVQRIILELLTNALKYTATGSINFSARLVEVKQREVILELRVSDTGMGIPKDKHEEVYTRFTRLTPSYHGIPGTGLGLSVVKQFIEDLSGEIHIESEPHQGTSFICLIPFQKPLTMDDGYIKGVGDFKVNSVVANAKPINDTYLAEVSGSQFGRVLLVEDNVIAAKAAKNLLSNFSCQVDIAADGATALERVESGFYDLIFMDIGLPDIDGVEVTRRIRAQQSLLNPAVPIIGLTAHIEAEKRQSCLANGMTAVYTKPLTPEKANKILNFFGPYQSQSQPVIYQLGAKPLQSVLVVDVQHTFEAAIKVATDKNFIKECLELLATGLSEDLETMSQAYQNKNASSVRAIAHKWKGGASYCGASHLEDACQQLEATLKIESLENAEVLYQQLIQIAEITKEAASRSVEDR